MTFDGKEVGLSPIQSFCSVRGFPLSLYDLLGEEN